MEIKNKTQLSWNFRILKCKRPAQKMELAILVELFGSITNEGAKWNPEFPDWYMPLCDVLP
jgi:hypothetical protein